MKISGIDLSIEEEAKLDSVFCFPLFKKRLKSEGIIDFIKEYDKIVTSCETETWATKDNVFNGIRWVYSIGISYEYELKISIRTIIQDIIDNVEPSKLSVYLPSIKSIDERLKFLLDKNPKQYRQKEDIQYPIEKYWWLYKLPYNVKE